MTRVDGDQRLKGAMIVLPLFLVLAAGCEKPSAPMMTAANGEEELSRRGLAANRRFPPFFQPQEQEEDDFFSDEPVTVPRIVSLPSTDTKHLSTALAGLYQGPERDVAGLSPQDQVFSTPRASVHVIPGCRNPSLAEVGVRRITCIDEVSRVIPAPEPSAFFFDGRHVLDARDGRRHGALTFRWYYRSRCALSPDGRTLAIALPIFRQDAPEISLIDVARGEAVKGLDASALGKDDSFHARHLFFLGNQRLAILRGHGSQGSEVIVVDLETDKVVRRFPTEAFSRSHVAFSPDGRYLALGREKALWLYNVAQGRLLTQLLPLKNTMPASGMLASDPVFSNSSTEVAVLTRDDHLLCWNMQGHLTFDRVLFAFEEPRTPSRFSERHLAWIPDGKGWLIDRTALYSRRCDMVVWRILHHGSAHCHFLDQNTLLTTRSLANGEEIVAVDVPWEAIGSALRAKDAGSVLVRPGDTVQVAMAPDRPRQGPPELHSQLVEYCTDAGLAVVEDDAVLRLEARFVVAGKQPTLITHDGRHIPLANQALRGTDVGVALRLVRNETDEVIWRFPANSKLIPPVLVSGEDLPDATKRMFWMIHLSQSTPLLPSMVPDRPDLPQLPLVTPLN